MRRILIAAALLLAAGTAAAQQPADLSQSGLVGQLENPTIVSKSSTIRIEGLTGSVRNSPMIPYSR